jgi:2-hydroxychromene-2-carboxylate isomerase
MKTITFYLDFISPYAWLAFNALPQVLQGISHRVVHKPVLLGAMLKHHGQLGPAEIAAKRDWTYRQVLWLAHQQGVELKLPSAHPFNPLALLRLAVACDADGEPNRFVCEQIFRHVWCSGQDAADAGRLAQLSAQLQPLRDPVSTPVKQDLQTNTEQALKQGLFGVPSFAVDDKVFWGQDALPMLRAYLLGDAWFDGPGWNAVQATAVGVRRQPS